MSGEDYAIRNLGGERVLSVRGVEYRTRYSDVVKRAMIRRRRGRGTPEDVILPERQRERLLEAARALEASLTPTTARPAPRVSRAGKVRRTGRAAINGSAPAEGEPDSSRSVDHHGRAAFGAISATRAEPRTALVTRGATSLSPES